MNYRELQIQVPATDCTPEVFFQTIAEACKRSGNTTWPEGFEVDGKDVLYVKISRKELNEQV